MHSVPELGDYTSHGDVELPFRPLSPMFVLSQPLNIILTAFETRLGLKLHITIR
jgi:hypothetical protein